jgi:hypothetical protein
VFRRQIERRRRAFSHQVAGASVEAVLVKKTTFYFFVADDKAQ